MAPFRAPNLDRLESRYHLYNYGSRYVASSSSGEDAAAEEDTLLCLLDQDATH